jgi:hypothetical protein
MTTSPSQDKHPLCVNDNYLFLVIHICAIAFITRVLFSILYPPFADGDETIVDKVTAMSVDLLKIKAAFFWYASVPFLYAVWKRSGGAAVGLIASVFTVIAGFFVGEWIGNARGSYPELVFLGAVALFLYPLLDRVRHRLVAKFLFGLLLGISFWVNTQSLFVIVPMVAYYASRHH